MLSEIYYTLGGDTRVYRRVLASGDVSVVHDFGAAGITRDVHAAGNRLTAIVGGRTSASAWIRSWDRSSGTAAGSSTWWISGRERTSRSRGRGTFRHPSLAPTGDQLVAEGYPLIITDVPGTEPGTVRPDTIVARDSDLYLFTVP